MDDLDRNWQWHPMNDLDRNWHECPECAHFWVGPVTSAGQRNWERCPNCGADDGANCWDCGEPDDYEMGFLMCRECRVTVCDACQTSVYGVVHECGTPRVT